MAVQVAEEDENDTEIDPDLKNAVSNLYLYIYTFLYVHLYPSQCFFRALRGAFLPPPGLYT